MAATTSLLGLVTPTQGTLSGTWGDTVNYGISDYVDISVAGTLTLTNDGAVTLANTTGSSSGNSITSSLTGAGTVTAQFAIVKVTGTLTTAKVVTGPSYSKTYTVVNSATGGIVTFKASGQTGVSIAVGESAFVYFNGTDYVKVSGTVAVASFQTSLGGLTPSTATTGVVTLAGTLNTASGGTGLTSFTAGDVPYYASGTALTKLAIGTAGQFLTSTGTAPQWSTLSGVAVTTFSAGTTGFTPSSATSGAVTLAGTLATTNGGTGLTSFTANGVVYASSSSALATGSTLVTNGSSLGVGSSDFGTAASINVSVGVVGTTTGGLQLWSTTTGQHYIQFGDGASGAASYAGAIGYNHTSDRMDFYSAGTLGMSFNSTGLGIGTSSPAYKLQVVGGAISASRARSNTAGDMALQIAPSDSTIQYGFRVDSNNNNLNLDCFVSSAYTTRAVLDAAGNLGLGVTPSAWISSYRTFSVGDSGFISSRIGAGVNNLESGVNWFRNSGGSFVYKANGFATNYGQQDGGHFWYNAPNNTSGASAALTLTQAMTLDASGNLGIGTTAPGARLAVQQTSAAAYVGFNITNASSTGYVNHTLYVGSAGANGQSGTFYAPGLFYQIGVTGNDTTSPITFVNNNGTERFRIAPAGQLGIGGANYGTNGQVLTSSGSGAAPTWTTVGGASAATPTALGTVYGKQTSGGGSPYLTAYGYNAAVSNTGISVTAIGTDALYANTTANNVTAVGYQALYANTATSNSTAVGANAGKANTTGQVDAFGLSALQSNTTGAYNQAFGGAGQGYTAALQNNTTGINNQAFGSAALQGNTTGSNNIAIGTAALYSSVTANHQIAIGFNALYNANKTANVNAYSTAVGYQAGKATTTGTITAIGANVLLVNTTGTGNVGVGGATDGAGGALQANTTGTDSTAVGVYSLALQTTGVQNIGIGFGAGQVLTGGGYSVFIGGQTYASSSGVTHEIVIGYGNTGKGANTGFISPNGGGVYQGNNSSSWSTTSDQRLKKNIVDNTVGLGAINSIRVRNFEYRIEEEITELPTHCVIKKEGVQLGVIAQELQAVLPDCVKQESTGVLSVDPDNLTWYMVNAIKDLKSQLDSVKAELATLKGA